MKTYIEVDDRILTRRLKQMERKFDLVGKKSVEEIAEWTKLRAKFLAPYDTGETRRFIISAPIVNRKGYTEAVVGFKQNPHPEKGDFNLPLWMHYSERAKTYRWRHGKDHRFLFSATKEARGKFFRRVESLISESIIGR